MTDSTSNTGATAPAPATTVPPDVRLMQVLVGLAVIATWIAIPAVGLVLHQRGWTWSGPPGGAPVLPRASRAPAPAPAPPRAPDSGRVAEPAPQRVPEAAPPAPAAAPSRTAPPTTPARPQGRTIRSDLAFRESGEPVPALAGVLRALSAPADGVGAPVSGEELRRLLDDPRASEVYWAELLKYASPRSPKLQKAEHTSFIPIFMKPARIAAGDAFLVEHARELAAARARYGVLPKDIVSVLMWESNLGTTTGKYRVVNVYLGQLLYGDDAATQAARTSNIRLGAADRARHAKRLARIKRNAEQYLVALLRSCRAKGVDPLTIHGSWAGAIGFPQFMPTSFRYAVDGDGDGAIDLYAFPDAIASVGNYLGQHGYAADRARAIHAYNPEDEYVRGVQLYADALTATPGDR